MIDAYLKKLRRRDEISPAEEAAIRDGISEIRDFGPNEVLIRAGAELDSSMLLITGWLARTKALHGGQQQLVELHVAGDFADLHSFTMKRLDHDVITLTRCRIAMFPHERLRAMTETHPHLTRVFWFSTNLDAAIQREWTFSMGSRSAISRMAHLFCEMLVRLEIVDGTQGASFDFPLTQDDLGDCLGLSSVHVNRTLQELRRQQLVRLESRRLTILDRRGLEAVAEFDPAYLHLDRRPR